MLNQREFSEKAAVKMANLAAILRRCSSLDGQTSRMEVDKRRSLLLAFVTVLVICAWAGLIFLAITVTQTVIAILEFAVEALSVP